MRIRKDLFWIGTPEEAEERHRNWWESLSQEQREAVMLEAIEIGPVTDAADKALSQDIVRRRHPYDLFELNQMVMEEKEKLSQDRSGA